MIIGGPPQSESFPELGEWLLELWNKLKRLAAIYARLDGTNSFSGNVTTASTGAFVLGDPTVDGSWQAVRSGNNLLWQRLEAGVWVTKQTITP